MCKFKLSNGAEADLREIAAYTEHNWGVEKRNAYAAEFFNTFAQLAMNPGLAQSADSIRQGYRKYVKGSHVIFFKALDSGCTLIVRILHKRMDVDRQLDK